MFLNNKCIIFGIAFHTFLFYSEDDLKCWLTRHVYCRIHGEILLKGNSGAPLVPQRMKLHRWSDSGKKTEECTLEICAQIQEFVFMHFLAIKESKLW